MGWHHLLELDVLVVVVVVGRGLLFLLCHLLGVSEPQKAVVE